MELKWEELGQLLVAQAVCITFKATRTDPWSCLVMVKGTQRRKGRLDLGSG